MAYEKQEWKTGDLITEGKLNHMEDGIANASDSSGGSVETITLTGYSGGISNGVATFGGYFPEYKTLKQLLNGKKVIAVAADINNDNAYINVDMVVWNAQSENQKQVPIITAQFLSSMDDAYMFTVYADMISKGVSGPISDATVYLIVI